LQRDGRRDGILGLELISVGVRVDLEGSVVGGSIQREKEWKHLSLKRSRSRSRTWLSGKREDTTAVI
jgi:hypothetical protein